MNALPEKASETDALKKELGERVKTYADTFKEWSEALAEVSPIVTIIDIDAKDMIPVTDEVIARARLSETGATSTLGISQGRTKSVIISTGIAVALLGRNSPLGIMFGAVLFAWLSEQANPLGLIADISPSVVQITQGVVVLAVVIAYEVVRRWVAALEQRELRSQLEPEVAA